MQNGHPICKLGFASPICILDVILVSSMQTGLTKPHMQTRPPRIVVTRRFAYGLRQVWVPTIAERRAASSSLPRKRAAHLQRKIKYPHRTLHQIDAQGFGPVVAFAAGQVCNGEKHASSCCTSLPDSKHAPWSVIIVIIRGFTKGVVIGPYVWW